MRPFVAWLILACASAGALGQNYPVKSIRVITPFPAGGTTDIIARTVGQKVTELLSQLVIVDNRSGAGGTIGADLAAKAPPDGYTLLIIAGSHTLAPNLYQKLPYDLVRDFAAVSLLTKSNYVLVVHPTVPVHSVKELIALAKAHPGKLTYGSPGIATIGHLAGEMFKSMTRTEMVHVAYKGDTPANNDLLGGQVDLLWTSIGPSLAHIKAGRMRALAVTSMQRSLAVPDLPTVAEAGGLNEFDISTWFGLVAPRGTSPDVIDKLAGTMAKILSMPDVKERFVGLGMEPMVNTPEQFSVFIKAEILKFAKLAKVAGVKPE